MRIGIAGSGKIVNTFLRHMQGEETIACNAICVREQSLDTGKALARQFSIPRIYCDYKEMLADPELDFIYIGIVNQLHYPYAIQALEAGKHVILEKPFTTTAEEAAALAETARGKGLFLFEAITNLYAPMVHKLRQKLPEIGAVKLVQGNYSQYSSRYDNYQKGIVEPTFDPACLGGSLYDINVYNLHLAVGLFGKPQALSYAANRGFNGVDTSGVLTMEYPGFTAVCCGAKDSESPCHFTVQGTKGYLQIVGKPSICASLEMVTGGEKQVFEDPGMEAHMRYEFRAFHEAWRNGDLAFCYRQLDHTVDVMELMNRAQEGAGTQGNN